VRNGKNHRHTEKIRREKHRKARRECQANPDYSVFFFFNYTRFCGCNISNQGSTGCQLSLKVLGRSVLLPISLFIKNNMWIKRCINIRQKIIIPSVLKPLNQLIQLRKIKRQHILLVVCHFWVTSPIPQDKTLCHEQIYCYVNCFWKTVILRITSSLSTTFIQLLFQCCLIKFRS
jgi:hypothetical protein